MVPAINLSDGASHKLGNELGTPTLAGKTTAICGWHQPQFDEPHKSVVLFFCLHSAAYLRLRWQENEGRRIKPSRECFGWPQHRLAKPSGMLRLGRAFVANSISPRRHSCWCLCLVRNPTIRRVNLRDSPALHCSGHAATRRWKLVYRTLYGPFFSSN